MDSNAQVGRRITRSRGKRLFESETKDARTAEAERPFKRRKTKGMLARDVAVDNESEGLVKSATKWDTGLLTPEPSYLTESQLNTRETSYQSEVFPFLDLPAELRVQIYRMALHRAEPLLLDLPRPDEKSEDVTGDAIITGTKSTTIVDTYTYPSDPLAGPHTGGINVAFLRTNTLIYKEARQVLYADNAFVLSLSSGIHTLSTLHQRSRSLIKAVTLTIPTHHDILDGFADLVRLGLRYCWGLKKFTIVLDVMFPDDRMMVSGATSVYANAFHILRWLPKGCKVALEGHVSEVVRNVVVEEGRLLEELDEVSYLKRQHQMPERH